MKKSVPVWRDTTPLERAAMHALRGCRFAPATMPKRFARTMASELDRPHRKMPDGTPWPIPSITDAQAALLWKLCHSYRRQITDPYVLAEAERRWVEHDWHEPTDLIKYPFCSKCLTIYRADGMNGPCKGPAKLRPMEGFMGKGINP